jgi:hypothetical protein
MEGYAFGLPLHSKGMEGLSACSEHRAVANSEADLHRKGKRQAAQRNKEW